MEKHLMAGRIRVWGFLSPSHLTLGLGDYVTNETLFICMSITSMATRLGRVTI